MQIFYIFKILACFHRTGVHWHDSDEERAEDVDDREGKINLDGPRQVRLCPSQPRYTEYRHSNAQLQLFNLHARFEKLSKNISILFHDSFSDNIMAQLVRALKNSIGQLRV